MSSYAVELEPGRAPSPAAIADESYQDAILPGVSRTFALTIPELPPGLREVVTNGYLLCRIADTIEDDPELTAAEKLRYHDEFHAAVIGRRELERELVRNAAQVVRVTQRFDERQRAALSRCVRIMCSGMPSFQRTGRRRGLEDLAEMHDYCYYVAGVVGEMLTELFCAYSSEIDARRADLERLAVSFGQALQMTNILKDVWDDLEHGFCWLPKDVFARRGFDLRELSPARRSPAFEDGMRELVAVAHAHLRDALEYTLAIPPHEKGIRRFCLWALFMAVLTLRKIARNIGFNTSKSVKISRRSVKAVIVVTNVCTSRDRLLRLAFAIAATGLPRPQSFEWTAPRELARA